MISSQYLVCCLVLLSAIFIRAQERKVSKFQLISVGSIGNGLLKNDNEPNYNVNINQGELLLNYQLSKSLGIATGIGLNTINGNGFNSQGNFSHERRLMKIPLLATFGYDFFNKVNLGINAGFYAQNIIKDEYRYLNLTEENVYEGWNFGGQFTIGLLYNLYSFFAVGIQYTTQADLSKFDTANGTNFTDSQKMSANVLGLMFRLKL